MLIVLLGNGANTMQDKASHKLIQEINAAVKTNRNDPITIITAKRSLIGVSGARSYSGGSISNIQPHTDIVLVFRNKKNVNISIKNTPIESLTKGNVRGLESIVPGITRRFMTLVARRLEQNGLETGERVPKICAKLTALDRDAILIGKTLTGGPIDLVYGGEMKSFYDPERQLFWLYGEFVDPDEWAKQKQLFLELQPKYEDQKYDPTLRIGGIPMIYGKSDTYRISEFTIILHEQLPEDTEISMEM